MHYTFYINYLRRGASHHTTSASGEYRKQFGMMAIKIERARTHFLSDVFTPVANVGSVILPTELEVLTPVSEVSRIQWRIRGEGPGGLRILPSRPDACLRLKFLHGQDRISLFNWLIFSMKRALHFATKQNSWDIKKCDCFWVLSSARKAVLPARTATGAHRGGCSKGVYILYGCIRKR